MPKTDCQQNWWPCTILWQWSWARPIFVPIMLQFQLPWLPDSMGWTQSSQRCDLVSCHLEQLLKHGTKTDGDDRAFRLVRHLSCGIQTLSTVLRPTFEKMAMGFGNMKWCCVALNILMLDYVQSLQELVRAFYIIWKFCGDSLDGIYQPIMQSCTILLGPTSAPHSRTTFDWWCLPAAGYTPLMSSLIMPQWQRLHM